MITICEKEDMTKATSVIELNSDSFAELIRVISTNTLNGIAFATQNGVTSEIRVPREMPFTRVKCQNTFLGAQV
jgi:hypothetical protein